MSRETQADFKHDESVSNILKLHVLVGGGLEEVDRSKTRTKAGTLQETRYYIGVGTQDGGETIPLIGDDARRILTFACNAGGDGRRQLRLIPT